MNLFLCTDMDRTLLPNGHEPASVGSLEKLARFIQSNNVTLSYVTGRDMRLVKEAISHYKLPLPDFVIADVGSTLYKVGECDWHEIHSWRKNIGVDWNGYDNSSLRELLSSNLDIVLQEEPKQRPFKLSYYVNPEIDYELLIKNITKQLEEHGIKSNIIWSVDDLTGSGLMDILPKSADKYQAIKFLVKEAGFSLKETLFCGDSGNDIQVMSSSVRSVLVANASDAVRRNAIAKAHDNDQLDTLYIAHGEFLGMNGNYSAGILEGIAHYEPVYRDWMENNYA